MSSNNTGVSQKPIKRVTVRKKFAERMKREGKYSEFCAKVKELSKVTNEQGKEKGHGPATWEAMKLFGYVGPEYERELYRQWEESQENVMIAKAAATFDEAVELLPVEPCPAAVQIAWIAAHPAMARKARQTSSQPVIISPTDILHAKHGPAPCKAAAIALQTWAQDPKEFQKMILSEQKKKGADGKDVESDDVVKDDGLAEVEKMYAELKKRAG